jgi:hypothetical protein
VREALDASNKTRTLSKQYVFQNFSDLRVSIVIVVDEFPLTVAVIDAEEGARVWG